MVGYTKTGSRRGRGTDFLVSDKIGKAKYVTKFDLVKGFWQIPLSDRAKEILAFVTPDGLYSCTVMPFRMKNAPSTFQRLMNHIESHQMYKRRAS